MKRFTILALACWISSSVIHAETPADLAQLQAKAGAGDHAAAFQLGRRYLRGEGAPRDYVRARSLLEPAAAAGNADAQSAWGFMLLKGLGVPKDEAKAIELITRAAEASVASAQLNLGILHLKGQGIPVNTERGLEWITKAADQGNVDACVRLAELHYFGGDGVTANPPLSFAPAAKAAAAGNAWAQNLLGSCHEHGIGTSVDHAAAREWYLKAAQQDDAKAQASYGRLLSNGRGGPADPDEAYFWLRMSQNQGEVTAKNFLPEFRATLSDEMIAAGEARVAAAQMEKQRKRAAAAVQPAQSAPAK